MPLMELNLPPNARNNRFFEDTFAQSRPALTLCGFDNAGDHSYGYGLKQIIELSQDPSSVEHSIVEYLLHKATLKAQGEPSTEYRAKTFVVNHNSLICQAQTFLALLTLVLEENDAAIPGLNMISHEQIMAEMRHSMLSNDEDLPLYAHEILSDPDRVKWTTSLANMSRSLDLYLALENAYAHYEKNESLLLTREEKTSIFDRHLCAISEVLQLVDSNIAVGAYISGNWSLKMWAGAAYACLGMQHKTEAEARQLFVWFGRGLRRSGPGDLSEKRRYWTYMSTKEVGGQLKDCQRTWSEGPYYLHFSLQDVIPLWHAVRSQGYLNAPEHDVSFDDPFFSPWFTEPINWLADLATPEGSTPPFDDGNRRPIFNANLMTWSSAYGNADISAKMNWVFQRVAETQNGQPTRWKQVNPDVMLVQLAIPKTKELRQPAAVVGNQSMLERDEQQLIVRHRHHEQDHFVCLHGEMDIVTIERGEGHEQPDQLQLLYYIGDRSIIMDAGYDRGFIIKNSSWNKYSDHNVMAYPHGDSGMKSPQSLTKQVSHTPVDFLFIDPASSEKLSILKGQTRLSWRDDKRIFGAGYEHETNGRYLRTVIFVADEADPYLIDINQIYNHVLRGDTPAIHMRYHVDSNDFEFGQEDPWCVWQDTDHENVHLFFDCVEQQGVNPHIQIDQTEVEERFRSKRTIQRFTYEGEPTEAISTVGIFKTSNEKPATYPAPLVKHGASYQIWQWDNLESDTTDVLVVRSLATPKESWQPIQFSIQIKESAIPLVCNTDQSIGFTRLHRGEIKDAFTYCMTQATDAEPV